MLSIVEHAPFTYIALIQLHARKNHLRFPSSCKIQVPASWVGVIQVVLAIPAALFRCDHVCALIYQATIIIAWHSIPQKTKSSVLVRNSVSLSSKPSGNCADVVHSNAVDRFFIITFAVKQKRPANCTYGVFIEIPRLIVLFTSSCNIAVVEYRL